MLKPFFDWFQTLAFSIAFRESTWMFAVIEATHLLAIAVFVGAVLIGLMLNAMTILQISNIYQNLIKATILLIAIVVDSLLNPRDEQTAQQGDI